MKVVSVLCILLAGFLASCTKETVAPVSAPAEVGVKVFIKITDTFERTVIYKANDTDQVEKSFKVNHDTTFLIQYKNIGPQIVRPYASAKPTQYTTQSTASTFHTEIGFISYSKHNGKMHYDDGFSRILAVGSVCRPGPRDQDWSFTHSFEL